MPRAKRICARSGCPKTADTGSFCPAHKAEADQARGTREQRGYGPEHIALRKQWEPQVATGEVQCAKCHKPIQPGRPWHLGHNDDRTQYTGPEHPYCNLSDAGRRSHR